MSIFDTLLGSLGLAKHSDIESLKAQIDRVVRGEFPLAYAGGEQWNIPDPSVYGNQADLYRQISWIASAVTILSQAGASVKFNVMSVSGEDDTDIPNHPFEMLLNRPNVMQSRSEFLEAWFGFRILTGNGYIWLNAADENTPPDEMWVVPSSQIVPVPDGKLYIRNYRYNAGDGKELLIPTWQIVHLKRFNPNNLMIGLSPIEAIADQAVGDKGRVKRDAKLYNEKNGRMPGILAFGDNFQDAEWESMKRDISDTTNQMRQYMLLRNVKQGGIQWISTAMSNVEMQFLETRRFTKEEIYDLFAPGLSSMLAVNATEANSKSGKATFAEYALWPLLDGAAQKISNDILPRYSKNLKGEFEEVRAKDRALELTEMQEYAKTHTVEEIRKKFYQDDPLGDERDKLLPAQVTASSGQVEPEPEPQPAQLSQPEPQEDENMGEDDMMEAKAGDARRWRRVARKAVKAGRPIPDFVTTAIPEDEQARIRAALDACKTLSDVDAAFDPPPVMTDALLAELRRANDLLARVMA